MTTNYHNQNQGQKGDNTFVSMATAYSLGVFNDNFFKQAAMLLAIGAGLQHLQGTATVIFALPFILFSAYAGWLADRFPKKDVVVHGKVLEVVAMLVGAYGVVTMNWPCILAMIFLMGLQSAIFGPALNGSIPEHFAKGEVTGINGVLKMVTTAAILIGIACAGCMLDVHSSLFGTECTGQMLIGITVVLISVVGLLASFRIKKYRAAAPTKSFPWAGPVQSLSHLWELRKDPQLMLAVLSDAFFYFLATLVILVINTMGLQQLGLTQTLTSLLSVALMLGVAAGSLFISRVVEVGKWKKVLVPGTVGMGIGLVAAASSPFLSAGLQAKFLFVSLIMTGFCGGIFLIPITSFIQVRPLETDKGQVIAVAGFCAFIGILLAGQAYNLLNNYMQPSSMLVWSSFVSFTAAAGYKALSPRSGGVCHKIIGWVVRKALKTRYSIEVKGLKDVRSSGQDEGILFLPNHPALIDPVLLISVLHERFNPRPLADHDTTDKLYIRQILKLVNAIRIPRIITNGRQAKEKVTAGIDTVITSLKQGDNILLYPAGRLYRSRNEKLGANSAVHTILQHNPKQRIVLVRTHGLWGSSFSWVDGEPAPLKKWKTYLLFALASLVFRGPKRRVTIEFKETVDIPRTADRLTINQALEQFYNQESQPNTYVPYFRWQGSKPVYKPDPEKQVSAQSITNVPDSIRELVLGHLERLAGTDGLSEQDMLAHDIGLDSLTIMELAVWVEQEFGHPVEDLGAMRTVGDVMLAACGQMGGGRVEKGKEIPGKWFGDVSEKELQLTDAANIPRVFLNKAASSPGKAIVADRISGIKTFRQVVTAIMILRKKFGKIDGRTLGIMLPASVSASVSYFATLFTGKIPVMLNWTIGPGQMQHCIKAAGVTHVVTARALMDKLAGQGIDLESLDVTWVCLEQIREEISFWDKIQALVKSYVSWSSLWKSRIPDTAVILFTSGSEAQPKAVPLSHANILANLKDFNSVLSFKESDRLLGMLPPFHSLGLAGTIIMPLCLGLKTTYHANPTEGRTVAGLIGQYKSTLLIGTPTFVNGILRSAAPGQLDSLRLLFTGAEKCPDYVYQEVERMLPQAVLCEGYGITECSPVVSINTPENPQPGTIGSILPSMEYLIVDTESGMPVEPGRQGLLFVRGDNVFSGYLNMEKNSPFTIIDGRSWYNTGDLVREDENNVLTFCGRIKRFIKLGGEMISLPAIESALQHYFPADHSGTPTLAVEATPCDNLPEVVLFTTLNVDREEINACIRKAGLSALHNIRRLVTVEAIPVLGTGKIDYRQLKTALA